MGLDFESKVFETRKLLWVIRKKELLREGEIFFPLLPKAFEG